MISYFPTDTKNLKKYPLFHFKSKGIRGYNNYKKAMLQIKVKEKGLITPAQLEASRRIISKLKKDTEAIIKFKHIQVSLSKKPLQNVWEKEKENHFQNGYYQYVKDFLF